MKYINNTRDKHTYTLFELVCHHSLFSIHFHTSYSYELREKLAVLKIKCWHAITEPTPEKSCMQNSKNAMIMFCSVRISAVFGLSRGDTGWNQSMTVIDLILLKEPGHHVAGVPVTQKTHRSKYWEMCWCFWHGCQGVKE